jgi:hypothetical protein
MGSPEDVNTVMGADRDEHQREILRNEISERIRQQALSRQTPRAVYP